MAFSDEPTKVKHMTKYKKELNNGTNSTNMVIFFLHTYEILNKQCELPSKAIQET